MTSTHVALFCFSLALTCAIVALNINNVRQQRNPFRNPVTVIRIKQRPNTKRRLTRQLFNRLHWQDKERN